MQSSQRVQRAGLTWYVKVDSLHITIADCIYIDANTIELTRINVPTAYRGRGYAKAILKAILEYADKHYLAMILAVTSSDGLNNEELVAWYNRHNFISQQDEPRLMKREVVHV